MLEQTKIDISFHNRDSGICQLISKIRSCWAVYTYTNIIFMSREQFFEQYVGLYAWCCY